MAFFKPIQSGLKQAKVSFDLGPYVNAYQQGRNSPQYQQIRAELFTQLTGVVGDLHWEDILNKATEGLEIEEAENIRNSPAAEMIDYSFVEILKNSLDEALAGYYETEGERPASITLTIDIDNETNPNQVSIKITDSGRGFPDDFLAQVQTAEARDAYIHESGSFSQKAEHDDRAESFGGRGRGLRIFAAAEQNLTLDTSGIYEDTRADPPPTIASSLMFDNQLDDEGHIIGAEIILTTPMPSRGATPVSIAETGTIAGISSDNEADNEIQRIKQRVQNIKGKLSSITNRLEEGGTPPTTGLPPMLDVDFDDDDSDNDRSDDDNFSPRNQ
ncbi:MAG: hypothetical protein K0U37_03525 [Gammaproteobacteria bacterium]|nr:hypothetical protein [Gammaproteobacteria bacterium]